MKLRLVGILGMVIGVLWFAPSAFATTYIYGATYSSNTEWTAANSPYVIEGTVTVNSGVTLTVDPGVIVKFDGQYMQIVVNGTMSAIGTAMNPIYFTSLQDDSVGGDTGGDGPTTGSPGQWLDMSFANGSSEIDYATITYGGYGFAISDGPLQVASGSLTLDHDTIENNGHTGLVVTGVSSPYPSATVTHSIIDDNSTGIYTSAATLDVDDNTDVSDNSQYGIKFNLPTGTSPAASTVDHSTIEDNGNIGVFIGVDNTYSDALYPSGTSDNIADNDSGDTDLYIPYVNESDSWEGNYWDDGHSTCSVDDAPYPYSHIGSDPNAPGPVTAGFYVDSPNSCYDDNVDTSSPSSSPIDNS